MTGAVQWGIPSHSVRMSSADAALMDLAQQLFQPWHTTGELLQHWQLDASGDGTFALSPPTLEGASTAANRQAALRLVEWATIQRLALSPHTPLNLHGALIQVGPRGVVLLGPSFAGKSTLAASLWARGHALLSDDLTFLVGPGLGLPAPRRICLRHASQPLFEPGWWSHMIERPLSQRFDDGWVLPPPGQTPRPVPVSHIFFLNPKPGEPPVQLLPAALGLMKLLPYASYARWQETGQVIELLAGLTRGMTFVQLTRQAPQSMALTVEQLLQEKP